MRVGIDIGYNATKAVCESRAVIFPSVVGDPTEASFGLNQEAGIILTEPYKVAVGDAAVNQSRFINRREDRRWIESAEWKALFLAAVTELTTASRVELDVVTGLPVAFYADRENMKWLMGSDWKVRRKGGDTQSVSVRNLRVIPQPFGSLIDASLNNSGTLAVQQMAGRVGVIDVGGKTTNILSVSKLTEVARETASVNSGGWSVVRSVRQWLQERCPGLEEMRDHDIAMAIRERKIRYYGEEVPGFAEVVDAQVAELAGQIISEAGQLWNGAALLDSILVTGGGAFLVWDKIHRHWKHSVVAADPVMGNARGYWKLAQRVFKGG